MRANLHRPNPQKYVNQPPEPDLQTANFIHYTVVAQLSGLRQGQRQGLSMYGCVCVFGVCAL